MPVPEDPTAIVFGAGVLLGLVGAVAHACLHRPSPRAPGDRPGIDGGPDPDRRRLE